MEQLPGPTTEICTSLSYLNHTYNIINLKTHVHISPDVNATYLEDSWAWYFGTPNITAVFPEYVDPSLGWVYIAADELFTQLPLAKPLLVDCPIAACVFALSGAYCDIQRYLVYFYLGFSLLAIPLKFLRGIAQLWLMTTGITTFLHLIIMGVQQSQSTNKFVDMDAMPSVLITCAGLVATTIWCSLRFPMYSRTLYSNETILFGYYSFYIVSACLLVLLIVFNRTGYDFEHIAPAVLLESNDAYWLTSPCYKGGGGDTGVIAWSGVFDYHLRQESELRLINMPVPTSRGTKALISTGQVALYGVSARAVSVGLFVLLLITAATSLVSCTGICRKRSDKQWNLSESTIRGCFILNVIFQAVPICTAFLSFAIAYEVGAHKHDILRGELPFQYGQWAPWLVTALVPFFTLFTQFFGLES